MIPNVFEIMVRLLDANKLDHSIKFLRTATTESSLISSHKVLKTGWKNIGTEDFVHNETEDIKHFDPSIFKSTTRINGMYCI